MPLDEAKKVAEQAKRQALDALAAGGTSAAQAFNASRANVAAHQNTALAGAASDAMLVRAPAGTIDYNAAPIKAATSNIDRYLASAGRTVASDLARQGSIHSDYMDQANAAVPVITAAADREIGFAKAAWERQKEREDAAAALERERMDRERKQWEREDAQAAQAQQLWDQMLSGMTGGAQQAAVDPALAAQVPGGTGTLDQINALTGSLTGAGVLGQAPLGEVLSGLVTPQANIRGPVTAPAQAAPPPAPRPGGRYGSADAADRALAAMAPAPNPIGLNLAGEVAAGMGAPFPNLAGQVAAGMGAPPRAPAGPMLPDVRSRPTPTPAAPAPAAFGPPAPVPLGPPAPTTPPATPPGPLFQPSPQPSAYSGLPPVPEGQEWVYDPVMRAAYKAMFGDDNPLVAMMDAYDSMQPDPLEMAKDDLALRQVTRDLGVAESSGGQYLTYDEWKKDQEGGQEAKRDRKVLFLDEAAEKVGLNPLALPVVQRTVPVAEGFVEDDGTKYDKGARQTPYDDAVATAEVARKENWTPNQLTESINNLFAEKYGRDMPEVVELVLAMYGPALGGI